MIRNGGSYDIDLVGANPSLNPWAEKKVKAVLVKQTPGAPAVIINNTASDKDLILDFPAR